MKIAFRRRCDEDRLQAALDIGKPQTVVFDADGSPSHGQYNTAIRFIITVPCYDALPFLPRVEQGMYGIQQALSTDFARVEQTVDLSLGAITEKMDLFRREMLAEIRAASK